MPFPRKEWKAYLRPVNCHELDLFDACTWQFFYRTEFTGWDNVATLFPGKSIAELTGMFRCRGQRNGGSGNYSAFVRIPGRFPIPGRGSWPARFRFVTELEVIIHYSSWLRSPGSSAVRVPMALGSIADLARDELKPSIAA